jgi:hypothetical protein
MTTLDRAALDIGMYPEIIPGFDSLELKRKIQAEIRKEYEGLTDEQIRERRQQAVEQADKRRAEHAKLVEANA